MILPAIITLLSGLLLLWLAFRLRKTSGLPSGRVIYSDTNKWEPVLESLFDPITRLTGRPDYLVKEGKHVIPVEVKSSRVKDTPYEGHVIQLAAYCHLVRETFGVRPTHGILHYPHKTFRIDYSSQLEAELHKILKEISYLHRQTQREVDRSHNSIPRCRNCGFESKCNQSLIN